MVTFKMKVYGLTYLWGNKTVKKEFNSALHLHVRNSDDGEQISFGVLKPNKDPETVAVLDPGESYTVLLNGISGVWASVENPKHSYIDCAVLDVSGPPQTN